MRILTIVMLIAAASAAQDPRAEDDLSTIDGVLSALYDVISGPPGPRDWDRMRALFQPEARLIPLRTDGAGKTTAMVLDLDGYIERSGPYLEKRGFFESELHRRTEVFGHLAHAFSTYESRATADAEPFARGINSIQLVRDGERWSILNVAWDEERFGGPIPARYLPVPDATPGSEPIAPLLEEVRKRHPVPALAAAVVRDGAVVATGAVGVRKQGDETPVTVDDRFHIGSDTKAMTAVLAAMLVDEGKLAWDTTLSDVLPETAAGMLEPYRGVTLERLLTHRGGFCHHVPEGYHLLRLFSLPGEDIRAQRLSYLELVGGVEPVSGTSYSNAGYVAVGAMIEAKCGKSWEEVIAERIFEPLGITTAGFGPAGEVAKVTQPWPHLVRDSETIPIPPSPNADNAPVVGPAGRVHLSIGDWGKFVAIFTGGGEAQALVSDASRRRLLAIEERGRMAMGWGALPEGHALGPAFVHSGSNTMNFAVAWIAPAEGLAVVTAANQGGPGGDAACRKALEALLGRFRASATGK